MYVNILSSYKLVRPQVCRAGVSSRTIWGLGKTLNTIALIASNRLGAAPRRSERAPKTDEPPAKKPKGKTKGPGPSRNSQGSGEQAGSGRVHILAPFAGRAQGDADRVPGLGPFKLGAADCGTHRRKPQRVYRYHGASKTKVTDELARPTSSSPPTGPSPPTRAPCSTRLSGSGLCSTRLTTSRTPQRGSVHRRQAAHRREKVGHHRHTHTESSQRPLLPPRVPSLATTGRQVVLDPRGRQAGPRRQPGGIRSLGHPHGRHRAQTHQGTKAEGRNHAGALAAQGRCWCRPWRWVWRTGRGTPICSEPRRKP